MTAPARIRAGEVERVLRDAADAAARTGQQMRVITRFARGEIEVIIGDATPVRDEPATDDGWDDADD